MTHDERYQRRVEIGEYLANGHTLSQAARTFRVCEGTVQVAARENGVVPARVLIVSVTTMQILARLLYDDCTDAVIARGFGITRSRVGSIAKMACEAGIRLRRPRQWKVKP